MDKYITIIDPQGATQYHDGAILSVNHRILFDGKSFYGYENLLKTFGGHHKMVDFLTHAINQSIGTHGTFVAGTREIQWSVSDVPV